MIGIEINVKDLKRLREAVGRSGKRIEIELAAAINATAKKTKSAISKDIRSVIAMKAKDVNQYIKQSKRASKGSLNAAVKLEESKRPNLRAFGARQDKRGVSYKIKKDGGRQRINSAFMWKRIDRAFIRVGKERLPIVQLRGVSPYATFAKNNFTKPQIKTIRQELSKQMERRIKLNILRAEGLVAK